ncbi:MAG: hypothetical protein EXQ47_02090 [Bryobacterales bacterium]|nr:hypothetical protein [Bryobacterales bacterium]
MRTRTRKIAALCAGALAYLAILYRFLSYTERNRMHAGPYLLFAGVALLIGFLLALGEAKSRSRIAGYVVLGTWIGLSIVIAIDTAEDPTNHNLLPFEYIYMGVLACPAYLGAALAGAVDRVVRGNPPPLT